MKHCTEVAQGFYKPEITGALKQPKGERYNVEQFHKASRVSKRFFGPFQIAYDSLVGAPKERSEEKKAATAAATADGATGIGEEVASEEKKKTEVTQIHVALRYLGLVLVLGRHLLADPFGGLCCCSLRCVVCFVFLGTPLG